MKICRKSLTLLLIICVTFSLFQFGCANKGKVKIYVDAGGQSGNYNTSVIERYDALERYAKIWNSKNDKYEIVINKYSMDGARESIVPLLSGGTAPDILFQLPTTIAEDIQNNWFVPLDGYLNKPNPYVEGNTAWRDIYDTEDISSSVAPDGHIYYVGIDKIVIGIAYNKSLFAGAGINEPPSVYSDFVSAQKKLYDKYADGDKFYPYLPYEELYNIFLEGSVFGSVLEQYDVLNNNGIVDTEELIRAYDKGIYSFDSTIYKDGFLKAIKDKMYFKTVGYENIAPIEEFLLGHVAMVEVKGDGLIRIAEEKKNFEIGVMPFPILDAGNYPRFDGTVTDNGFSGKNVKRGSAGIGTGWWVTNSALKKGDAAVNACADFLMYVTSPEVNNAIVGERGCSIPLNPDDKTEINELLSDMMDYYIEDGKNSDNLYWSAFNSASIMNKDYYDTYITCRKTFMVKDKIGTNNVDAYEWMALSLDKSFSRAATALKKSNNYDESKW